MKVANKKPIYGGALMARLEQLGMSATQASVEMGFSEPYLSNCFKRGWMPDYAIRLVKARFGVPYDEYKGREEDEKKAGSEPVNDTTADLILEELRTIRALMQEIAKALQ